MTTAQATENKSVIILNVSKAPRVVSKAEIAKELGVSPSMIRRWREQFEPEASVAMPVGQGER
ncbi:MAG: helix-turn-helix domain-containing protein [Polyangiaceae bacterium]